MGGEVVTFATEFERWDSAFGDAYRAMGPFDVSVCRDAVMVHRAMCETKEESVALCEAIEQAEQVPPYCTHMNAETIPRNIRRCQRLML